MKPPRLPKLDRESSYMILTILRIVQLVCTIFVLALTAAVTRNTSSTGYFPLPYYVSLPPTTSLSTITSTNTLVVPVNTNTDANAPVAVLASNANTHVTTTDVPLQPRGNDAAATIAASPATTTFAAPVPTTTSGTSPFTPITMPRSVRDTTNFVLFTTAAFCLPSAFLGLARQWAPPQATSRWLPSNPGVQAALDGAAVGFGFVGAIVLAVRIAGTGVPAPDAGVRGVGVVNCRRVVRLVDGGGRPTAVDWEAAERQLRALAGMGWLGFWPRYDDAGLGAEVAAKNNAFPATLDAGSRDLATARWKTAVEGRCRTVQADAFFDWVLVLVTVACLVFSWRAWKAAGGGGARGSHSRLATGVGSGSGGCGGGGGGGGSGASKGVGGTGVSGALSSLGSSIRGGFSGKSIMGGSVRRGSLGTSSLGGVRGGEGGFKFGFGGGGKQQDDDSLADAEKGTSVSSGWNRV